MQLNPSEISDLIKKKIENFDTSVEVHAEGTVVSVTDGIVRIHGLSDAMQGEMLEFPGGSYGMALNLERDSVSRTRWSGCSPGSRVDGCSSI